MFTVLRNIAVRPARVGRRRSFPGSLAFAVAAAFALAVGCVPSAFAATATTTTLTVTSGGSAVTSVASGSKVTLTAIVSANGAALTTGLVNFCDATATYCTDIHILASAQLTSAGTAVVNLRPSIGTHSYKAVFAGTTAYAKSTSSSFSLNVPGLAATNTLLSSTGSGGNYTVTATVSGAGNSSLSPTGTVSFLDTSNGNAVVGTATLGKATAAIKLVNSSSPSSGSTPVALATADFNGDGWPDVAVVNAGSNTVVILLNNGDGTFTMAPSNMPAPENAHTISVADFNADGKPDLVVGGDAYTVYLGNGDGSFSTKTAVTIPGISLTASIVADFNNDGIADLVFGGTHGEELLGNGDGTFTAPVDLGTSTYVLNGQAYTGGYSLVTAGDFNGDGNTDVFLWGPPYGSSLLYGNGDGSFQPTSDPIGVTGDQSSAFGYIAGGLTAADYNSDGLTDVIIQYNCYSVLAYRGNKSTYGQFGTGATISIDPTSAPCKSGTLLAVGDFNHDGLPDLLWSEAYGNLAIRLNQVNYTSLAPDYSLPLNLAHVTPTAMAVADFDGDGYSDVVIADGVSSTPILLTRETQTVSVTHSSFSLPQAGNHLIVASYPGDANFAASVSGPLSLTQTVAATLTLSANPTSTTYGQPVTLTASLSPYTVQGQSTDGESITFSSGSAVLGKGTLSSGVATFNLPSLYPGSFSFTAAYAGDANLPAVGSNTLSYTVGKIPAGITWSVPSTATYTGQGFGAAMLNAVLANPGSLGYTVTPAGGSSMPLYATTVLPVGSYTLTATTNSYNPSIYASNSISLPYTVTPAPLTYTPTNVTRVYGAANPPLTATVSGALNGDSFSVVGTTTATSSSPVGTYPIAYVITGSNIGNYSVTPGTGTLTITQATPTLFWGIATITYGTPLSSAQLNAVPSTAGTLTYSPAAGTVLSVGIQPITVSFIPSDTTNYASPITKTISITVNKAPLTISAANTARVYGAANPTFTGSVTGAMNGDAFTESFSTSATATSPVGGYPIVPSVAGTALSNYSVQAANGVLTISQVGTATTFALSNGNTTFTATVNSLTSGSPTGTVGFYEGQTLVGTGTLAGGVATFTASSAPPANTVVSAQYSGDVNFTQSASPPILLLSMQPASSSLSVASSGSVTDAITLSAASGFTGALTLSCSGLPQGATCSFNPASVTFSGTATSASSTMTIHTGGTAANVRPLFPGSFERNATFAAMFWIPGLFASALVRRKGKKRSPMQSLLMLLLFTGVAASLTACGGSPVSSGTATGTSSVTVLATGSNGFTQSTSVTLNVQ